MKIGKSTSETLAILILAYGKYAMKKSSVFEWHRWFKEGQGDVQDDARSGQPKTQRTDANVDLVCSEGRVGVRVIAEELIMNREAGQQIVKKYLGVKNFLQKWCLESRHMTRNSVGFTFCLIFYAMQTCLIGSLPVMKQGVLNMTRKQNDTACSGKNRIKPRPKKARVSQSQVKHMLVCFFEHKGIVHYEFISQGQTLNQQCY